MEFGVVLEYGQLFLKSFLVTIKLAVVATILGSIIGGITGIILTTKNKVLKLIFRIYVEIFRGSPLILQLFMIYYGLPYLDIHVSISFSIILSFTLYSGAYIAEIVRAGIESVPTGQWEAAQSIGLSYSQKMRFVIMPQTIKVTLAPLMGFYLGLIKDTSLASTVGYMELVKMSKNIMNMTGKPFESYIIVAVCFFCICWPLSKLVEHIERKSNNDRN